MNRKDEIKFAKWVDGDDRCKVKFYQCVLHEGCTVDRWSFHFDGDHGADWSDGRTSLTSSIHDYLVYSSQRIKELEAQLALKQMDNERSNKTLLFDKVIAFFAYFELVFGNDWSFTKGILCESDSDYLECFIAENGTFVNPFPGEFFTGGKGDNWANRTQLLDHYRELRAYLISEGLYNTESPA